MHNDTAINDLQSLSEYNKRVSLLMYRYIWTSHLLKIKYIRDTLLRHDCKRSVWIDFNINKSAVIQNANKFWIKFIKKTCRLCEISWYHECRNNEFISHTMKFWNTVKLHVFEIVKPCAWWVKYPHKVYYAIAV